MNAINKKLIFIPFLSILLSSCKLSFLGINKDNNKSDGEYSYEVFDGNKIRNLVVNNKDKEECDFSDLSDYIITSLGDNAFADCKVLKKVIIPDTVISIGENAFSNCAALKELDFGIGIQRLDKALLEDCQSLEKLSIPFIGEKRYSLGEETYPFGYLFRETGWDTEGITPQTFHDEDGEMGGVTQKCFIIPKTLNEIHLLDCSYLPTGAFSNFRINSLELVKTITQFGDRCFEGSNITNLYFDFPIESLCYSNFDRCDGYQEGSNPWIGAKNIYVINNYGSHFLDGNRYSEVTSLVIPEDLTTIPELRFRYFKQLKSIVWPSHLESIGAYAFSFTGLESLIIPDCTRRIEYAAFNSTPNLSTIVLGKNLEYVAQDCFSGSNTDDIFFHGSESEYHIETPGVPGAFRWMTIYYYSESMPSESGNYWRYVNGVPTKW